MTSSRSECISVAALQPDLLPYYWEIVEPMLQKAVDLTSGEITTDDVYLRLQRRLMQLLVVIDREKIIAAGVTEVVDYPQFRKLRVVLLGGKGARRWRDKFMEKLDEGGRAVGAKEIEWCGRRGWVRFFNDDPRVRERYCVMTKEVSCA